MVQVIKDPIGTKGARLSTQISIAGPPARLPAAGPAHRHLAEDRERSRARSAARAAAAPAAGRTRKAASSCAPSPRTRPSASCRRHRLPAQDLGDDRGAGAARAAAPALLYQDLNLAQRVLRDLVNDETHAHPHRLARERSEARRLRRASTRPRCRRRLQHYTGERPLFDLYDVEDEIEQALARRVDLKSGGYLIIDQTEALTTIDVNTGGFVGARNFDDTIFKTNLEAAQAIARQLRLRNLGGIIIIDFIDMENAEHRDAVLAELKQGARARPHAHDGERLHAARPGRDDAQAHARVARAHAVRAVPDLRGHAAR